MDAVELAYQIVDMDRTIRYQKAEIERLLEIEVKYNELLDSSRKHSEKMFASTLQVLLTPGVAELFTKPTESNTV